MYYDTGWNANVNKEPFDPKKSQDWKDGWKDCNELPQEEKKLFEEMCK
jgi:hypothetical protein